MKLSQITLLYNLIILNCKKKTIFWKNGILLSIILKLGNENLKIFKPLTGFGFVILLIKKN
jgi:hypothetical protein